MGVTGVDSRKSQALIMKYGIAENAITIYVSNAPPAKIEVYFDVIQSIHYLKQVI